MKSTRKTFTYDCIIDEVTLDFHEGKIVRAETSGNPELLNNLLDLDKRSRYLGEVALVSEDSSIASQPMSFKNLLFDENSGCHIAFGTGYPDSIRGGASMTEEGLLNAGVNVSKQHIDLIIGSDELSVTGITDNGSEVEILKNGIWTGDFI